MLLVSCFSCDALCVMHLPPVRLCHASCVMSLALCFLFYAFSTSPPVSCLFCCSTCVMPVSCFLFYAFRVMLLVPCFLFHAFSAPQRRQILRDLGLSNGAIIIRQKIPPKNKKLFGEQKDFRGTKRFPRPTQRPSKGVKMK